MRSVVITGVSTGIGHAAAKVLIDRGFRVFGSVRRAEDADRLTEEFGDAFAPLIFDVTDDAAIAEAAACVRGALAGETLAGLVNNAGIAVSGPLTELPVADYRRQLEVNLVGPFMVTQAFAPLLGTDSSLSGARGRIVNISSVAGLRAMPFLGPYAASKFGLEGYSEALRREMLLYGIDVIVIGPGPVQTAIWDKAEEVDVSAYAASPYAPILERCHVNPYINTAPWVVRDGEAWRMYYVAGVDWVHADLPRYNIQIATSDDGRSWARDGRVAIDFESGENALARPFVYHDGDHWVMWFAAKGEAYRAQIAYSDDGLSWTRDPVGPGLEPSPDGPDSDMMEYFIVLPHKGKRVVFYNGNDYGRAGVCAAVER